jgi:hypothetical protein
MKRLDQEVILMWIAALRSGDYQHGKGALCQDSKYCCLGVLHDIIGEEWVSENDGYAWGHRAGEEGEVDYWDLPEDLKAELGRHYPMLISMNDFWNADFNRIAKYIEENIL